jgi:chemotaxis response regulator CheB
LGVIILGQKDNNDAHDAKIRVAIIDDAKWIKLLTTNINTSEDILIIGSANTVEKAVELVKTLEPDIVLLDISLTVDRYDGIDTARKQLF